VVFSYCFPMLSTKPSYVCKFALLKVANVSVCINLIAFLPFFLTKIIFSQIQLRITSLALFQSRNSKIVMEYISMVLAYQHY
jgi:hypothetical protein